MLNYPDTFILLEAGSGRTLNTLLISNESQLVIKVQEFMDQLDADSVAWTEVKVLPLSGAATATVEIVIE